MKKGARAVVLEKEPKGIRKGAVLIRVRDTSKVLPKIAANYYGEPASGLKIIGVTGTNGKTTITYLLESILKKAGKKVGVVGTINYRYGDKAIPSKNTTPGPLELQGIFAEMAKTGVEYVVMEVSSHSLDQERVLGIEFDAAIFTNITREHLDYHRTLARYYAAKRKIFSRLKADGVAILNADDKKVFALKKGIQKKVLTYGIDSPADCRADHIDISLEGSRFVGYVPDGCIEFESNLIGRHNVSNILAAVAIAFTQDIDFWAIKSGVEALNFVPGRLESVKLGQSFKVYIDYAHTDDALGNVLSLLKGLAGGGKIITVFGCGGNRDRQKRPRMGKVACRYSDLVIITSDNPRKEDPRSIVKEIVAGVRERFCNYRVVIDRRKAISIALARAEAGDIVLIAGKGHERHQILRDRTIPFDDFEIAASIVKRQGMNI